MTDIVKSIPNDKKDCIKDHILTPEQRNKIIVQKLERAVKQFKANTKTPVVV